MVDKGLEEIYIGSKSVAEQFDMRSVPFDTFQKIINLSHLEARDKSASEFMDQFNKMLETMYQTGVKYALSNNSENIPLTYIREMVDLCKENFKQALTSNV